MLSRFIRFAEKQKTWVIVSVYAAVLLAFIFILYFTIRRSSGKEFCASCHIMRPYIANLEKSPHRDVSCYDCHAEPGIINYAKAKIKGVRETALYLTKSYPPRLLAHTPDSGCLRSGCHSLKETDDRKVKRWEINFSHREHLSGTRADTYLECSSCHSQMYWSSLTDITKDQCYLCHLKASNKKLTDTGECGVCHIQNAGREKRAAAGCGFSSGGDTASSCYMCHLEPRKDMGAASAASCVTCHGKRDEKDMDNGGLIHELHDKGAQPGCLDCHSPVNHGKGALKIKKGGQPGNGTGGKAGAGG